MASTKKESDKNLSWIGGVVVVAVIGALITLGFGSYKDTRENMHDLVTKTSVHEVQIEQNKKDILDQKILVRRIYWAVTKGNGVTVPDSVK